MFQTPLFITIFLTGLATGSFLNSIIYRLHTGKSFLTGRSYCPKCKHILGWQDLIPLLSFLILKGKCRYCQEKISYQYPIVEFFTGASFVFSAYFILSNPEIFPCKLLHCYIATLFYWFFISALIIIFVYDLKHFIIPDKIIYPAIGMAFLCRLFEVLEFGNWDLFGIWGFGFGIWKSMEYSLSAAIGAAAFFLMIVLISRGKWMGWGDPKLAFFMGLLLGFPNILIALFLAFFIGAIIGIGLIISGKKTLKSEVPFGPFLVIGTFIALFWGHSLINWYLHLFW